MAGPRSLFHTHWVRYHPKLPEVKKKVATYFSKTPNRPTDPTYFQALHKAGCEFRVPRVRPLHINDSIRCFQHTNKSPGLPYTLEGFKRKDEVPPQRIKHYVHNLKYGIYSRCDTPCTAAVKTMVAKRPKFRLIWVYPAHMTFAEGMFANPLIKAYQEKRGSYGLWLSFAKGDMRYLMSTRRPHNKWLGADWSGFDTTIPAWLIRDAFDILRDNIDFTRYKDWGVPTDPDTLPRLWDRIIKYFIDTPIRFQDGLVVKKHRGVPSGSYFTNLIDSVVSCIVWHYLLPNEKGKRFYVGDDALIELSSSLDLKDLAARAHTFFGMNLNPDKSEIGDHVSFLGYSMGPDGRPHADYDKLVAQLLLPSRPDHSFLEFCSRARALQLSCFGLGCWQFTVEVQSFLDDLGPNFQPRLHSRDDIMTKLEALDLAHWPPLHSVMLRV
nr:MAG: putative RNA-dependent RNA polymerase [Partitiviridae sp.]